MKPYNHGDKSQVDNSKNDEELARDQVLRDIRVLMEIPEGQRMFQNMFSAGHIEASFFKGNSSDAFRLGQRDVVLQYWNLCKQADPETFFKIVLEIKDE